MLCCVVVQKLCHECCFLLLSFLPKSHRYVTRPVFLNFTWTLVAGIFNGKIPFSVCIFEGCTNCTQYYSFLLIIFMQWYHQLLTPQTVTRWCSNTQYYSLLLITLVSFLYCTVSLWWLYTLPPYSILLYIYTFVVYGRFLRPYSSILLDIHAVILNITHFYSIICEPCDSWILESPTCIQKPWNSRKYA
jgi:hypothetical protein